MAADGSRTSSERLSEAREAMKTVKEISELLNTGLTEESLRVCVQLLEAGVNPEALATVVQELRRESTTIAAGVNPETLATVVQELRRESTTIAENKEAAS